MGIYHAVCETCAEELVTESVTEARQLVRAHREEGHRASYAFLAESDEPAKRNEGITPLR